jgi:hypothetical protein
MGGREAGDVMLVLIILFVGITSFGLGRLSVLLENKPAVVFSQPALASTAFGANPTGGSVAPTVSSVPESGQVVASKNGTKYHFPWCSGAQRIKEENKVWFASIEEARGAGYTPAGNCKGLK